MNNITVFVLALIAVSAVSAVSAIGTFYFYNKKNNDRATNEDE